MKIAQVAPCWVAVPPSGYGGIETVVALLADGLTERGHEVTLFAPGGSRTKAALVAYYDEPLGTARQVENPIAELPHLLHAYRRAREFDIIHDHAFPLGPALGGQLSRPPVVHTLHWPPHHRRARGVYEFIDKGLHLVAVSNYQHMARPDLRYAATIYNGVAVEQYPFKPSKQGYLLFVGRMSPDKGVHLAVEAAVRAGRELLIASKLREPFERQYFEERVEPYLGDTIRFLGEVGFDRKRDLYAGASCTLVPIQWAEPFGLVMIESLACGTPVVALRRGSVPEIVQHGVTGFVAGTLDEFVAYLDRIDEIDPHACRHAAATRFGADRMVDNYERLYTGLAPLMGR